MFLQETCIKEHVSYLLIHLSLRIISNVPPESFYKYNTCFFDVSIRYRCHVFFRTMYYIIHVSVETCHSAWMWGSRWFLSFGWRFCVGGMKKYMWKQSKNHSHWQQDHHGSIVERLGYVWDVSVRFLYCNEPSDWWLCPLALFESETCLYSCGLNGCGAADVQSLTAAVVLTGH